MSERTRVLPEDIPTTTSQVVIDLNKLDDIVVYQDDGIDVIVLDIVDLELGQLDTTIVDALRIKDDHTRIRRLEDILGAIDDEVWYQQESGEVDEDLRQAQDRVMAALAKEGVDAPE